MTDLEKVLGKTGARKFWNKVLGNVKILTGDVAYNTKGDLQTQINAVADTASTAKTTADAAKTAAEDAKVAAGEIVTDTTDKFDSTKDYAVGDYVIYDNKAWKFTTVHPAGAWDESHVEQTNILAEIAAQNKNSLRQIWKKLETSKRSISIPTDLDYSELAIYISTSGVIVGEIHVVKEYLSNVGKIFRCGNGFITGITENILIQANVSLSTITGSIYVKDSVVSSETTIFYR